jgi:4-hydroxy-3-polyprenylbenzoate decarboxylase
MGGPLAAMPQAPQDLRSWISLLREAGELVDVQTCVSSDLEITEIADRVVKSGGPALLFHHVQGSPHPLLINQFGTEQRVCLGLGARTVEDACAPLTALLGARSPQPSGGSIRGAARLRRLADLAPYQQVGPAPCQEVVCEPDLDLLPVQRCWPQDPAPFLTLPLVITRDPQTGVRNVGVYRMQKIDRRTCFLHWQVHKDGAEDWRHTTGERMEVAVALGCDPATTYAAVAPFPHDVDELAVAGLLRGAPVATVAARTVDLQVPANAEIILEGHIRPGETGPEGPFGDHTGYYSPVELFPILHLTGMTMRTGAIYPSIVVGPPPAEDAWLGKLTERLFLPTLRLAVPEVVDYDLPVAGAFQHMAIVAIRKQYPGQARKVIHALWGSGLLALLKCVIVVDDFVDVHDYAQVTFHVCANVDPVRDMILTTGALDQLDHAPDRSCYGGKAGIDATHKLSAEAARPWPKPIRMTPQIQALVDRRWAEYGIGAAAGERTSDRDELPF